MTDLGRALIAIGLLLLVVGAVVLLLGRFNVPLGRLPGDIAYRSRSGNTHFYFPVVTCIVVSIVLSLLLWIVNHFRR